MKISMEQRRDDLERTAWTVARGSIVVDYMKCRGIPAGTRVPTNIPPSAMIHAIIKHEYKDQ
jgi:hypothetical protein